MNSLDESLPLPLLSKKAMRSLASLSRTWEIPLSLKKLRISWLERLPVQSLSSLSWAESGAKSAILQRDCLEDSRLLSPSPMATSTFLSLLSDSTVSICFYFLRKI